jgi:hypothetical protein
MTLTRRELIEIQNLRANPAVSLLVPTHRHAPENQQDPIRVRNGLRLVEERLNAESGLDKRQVAALMARFGALVDNVDWNHTLDGLALFVSEAHASTHIIPYTVTERVILGETFATRDLVRALNRAQRYRLVVLSEKPTRLYNGFRDKVIEVRGHGFPMHHEGQGGSAPLPGGRCVNASAVRDERHRQFFRQVDAALAELQKEDRLPIVIAGVDRYQAFWDESAASAADVVARIQGSYDAHSPAELARLAWPEVSKWIDTRKVADAGNFEKAVTANRFASGAVASWRAANESRVAKLLVEENYAVPGVITADGMDIALHDDPTAPGVVDDIVDELIELVIARVGEVVFVPDGTLGKHERVGAELRY